MIISVQPTLFANKFLLAISMARKRTDPRIRELLLVRSLHKLVHKCSITVICWTVSWLVYSGIAMPCLKGHETEMFKSIAACLSSENQ